MPGTELGSKGASVNKRDKIPAFSDLMFYAEAQGGLLVKTTRQKPDLNSGLPKLLNSESFCKHQGRCVSSAIPRLMNQHSDFIQQFLISLVTVWQPSDHLCEH